LVLQWVISMKKEFSTNSSTHASEISRDAKKHGKSSVSERPVLDADILQEVCVDMLVSRTGFSQEAAQITVRHLIDAERAGKSCHGIVRLFPLLENKFGFKRWDRPPATALADCMIAVDGTERPGIYVVDVLLDAALDVARKQGICLAFGKNIYPSGHLGGYGLKAAEQGFCAHIEATSPSRVASPGQSIPIVGTNPICRAFPVTGQCPVVIDLATSAITHGDMLVAESNGETLPHGVAVQSDGTPATSVSSIDKGALLPFGQRDAYKAFALAMGVSLQTSYSGTPPASQSGTTFGVSIFVFDPKKLDPLGEDRRESWLVQINECNHVRIPGWFSMKQLINHRNTGTVEIHGETWGNLKNLFGPQLAKRLLCQKGNTMKSKPAAQKLAL